MYLPNFHCAMNLVTDIDDRRYQMLLCNENVEIRDAFKHGLSRRNSLKTKCSNWTRLSYRGNTSSEILPRWDECLPRFYLGKDEVGCGNTASLTRGGPAARTRQMGQYFQAVL